jgi:hypothetical protein
MDWLLATAPIVDDHPTVSKRCSGPLCTARWGYGVGGIPYTMHDMTQEKMIVLMLK